jgi:hypothetical protein
MRRSIHVRKTTGPFHQPQTHCSQSIHARKDDTPRKLKISPLKVLKTCCGVRSGKLWKYRTTFKIYLPVADKVTVKEKSGRKESSVIMGSETILVMDDNEQVCRPADTL